VFTRITNTSLVSGPGINVARPDSSALEIAIAKAKTSSTYKQKIRKLALILERKVSDLVSNIVGGTLVDKKSIINPVFTTTLDVTKDTIDDVTIKNDSTITSINIVNKVTPETSSNTTYNEQLLKDIDRLQSNSVGLFNLLATEEITKRLITNFNSINFSLKYSGRSRTKSIRFNVSDVIAGLKNGTMKLSVTKTNTITTIVISISIDALVTAINAANALIVRELSGSLGKEIVKIIAEQTVLTGPQVMSDVRSFLKSLGFEYALNYVKNGELNRTQIIKKSISKQQPTYQSFISAIQWTALVQSRLGTTMERLGNPDAPDIKERTGRFRSSVVVTPDYKRDLIRYTYMPLYTSLERYGYKPNLQVEDAINVVAQQQFSKAFRIIKI
jgi:hypothetical protein